MFITFEGIDGSGKSTQARLLAARLEAEGYPALLVREPGGTPLSERVRQLLLDPTLHVVPWAELLLFSAARAQLVAERIRPALAAGQIVLCDRFYDSTTVYQGAGRGLQDAAWLQAFNLHVTGGLTPDYTYLLDVPIEVALVRQAGRQPASTDQGGQDRMETGGRAFYERISAAYARLAEEAPERVVKLDGTQSVEALHAQIWERVRRRLSRRGGTPASS